MALGIASPVSGQRKSASVMPGITDASFYQPALRIPVVIYGPGEVGVAHQPDEWVAVPKYPDAIRSKICRLGDSSAVTARQVCILNLTDSAKLKAQKTYNLASDYFDARPLEFWARYGRRTVERLALRPGARVLDVACGTGASALPAAEAVGPTGRVTGVDLAERLLAQGREKAKQKGVTNIEFLQADMTELGYPDAHFDAIICVFGVFFVPNMQTLVAELWRMVRPGSKLAVTTWGPRIFAPAYDVWNEAVRKVRSDLYAAYNPWDRITTPEAVRTLFRSAGIPSVDVEPEDGYQPLSTPEDFWTIALGSGLRWTIDQLGPQGAEQVKQVVLEWLAAHKVDRLETNVIYAMATRGPKG